MESALKIGGKVIKVTHPEGTELAVEGTSVRAKHRPEVVEFKKELAKEGIPWGDVVKWATDKMGIRQCPSCHQAQMVMNQANKLGWKEVFRQVREIKGW